MARFGFRLIVGDPQTPFGNGKTYFITRYVQKQQKNAITIGNYQSPYFDFNFSTTEELRLILDSILLLQERHNAIKPIPVIIVIDESAIYFSARDFKAFPKNLQDFMVQLRKVNVYMPVITQSINMIDKNFRRLAQDVIMYTPLFLFTIEKQYICHNPEDGINFIDPMSTTMIYRQIKLHPRLRKWLNLGHPKYFTRELMYARPYELPQIIQSEIYGKRKSLGFDDVNTLCNVMYDVYKIKQKQKKLRKELILNIFRLRFRKRKVY